MHRSSNPAINPLSGPDVATTLPFYVVGNDDGFMPALGAPMTTLQMGPAERYDVVIDFSCEWGGACELSFRRWSAGRLM